MPVFNEARVLESTFARLAARLDQIDVSWSILFVNDGSVDDTVPVLESLAARDSRVTYLCLSRNFGHQAALSAGLDHADADLVVTMDGDLQHPPELLPVLVDAWRRGYDVVHTRKLSTEGLPSGGGSSRGSPTRRSPRGGGRDHPRRVRLPAPRPHGAARA